MAWIELHQALRKHPKTLHLASILGLHDPDHARVKLENLWLWALDYCPHGRLTVRSRHLSAAEIASASDWHDDATVWLTALKEAGFIDEIQGGVGGKSLQLHDWQQYGGKLFAARQAEAERGRERRSGGRPDSVRPASVGREERGEESLEEREKIEERGGHAPPHASASPLPDGEQETPAISGQDQAQAMLLETVEAFGGWKHPPIDKKTEAVCEMLDLGLSHDYIRSASQLNRPADIGFWDMVKGLKAGSGMKRNGRSPKLPGADPGSGIHVPVEKPPVLRGSKEADHKRQDEARAKCDQMLEAMSPAEREQFFIDAALAADASKLPVGPMREAFIKTDVRRRVAKQYAIEGL